MIHDLLRPPGATVSYDLGADVPHELAPRPFLTAATAAGIPVTAVRPDDHLHHLGLSLTLPDVNGTTFWGGTTYVRDRGPALLDNHGTQRTDAVERTDGGLISTLTWLDRQGERLLEERRTVEAREIDERLEVLWASELTATDRPVSLGSPETNGRAGAFYGGIFWRAAAQTAHVRSADGDGVAHAHGSHSPWLAVEGGGVTLVAVTTTGLPWFVRSEGYVGFCPAVAAGERREIAVGDTLRLDLATAVVAGHVPDPAAIADRLLQGAPAAGRAQ